MSEYSACPICGRIAYARDRYGNGFYCFPSRGGCGTKFPPAITPINGIYSHTIPSNTFLERDISGYFHDKYVPTREGGSSFSSKILKIKSDADESIMDHMANIIANDLDTLVGICQEHSNERPLVLTVPRSKPDDYWQEKERKFRPTVSRALERSKREVGGAPEKWMQDGVNYIIRVKPTQTTHRAHLGEEENTGPAPYVGITGDTCRLDGDVEGRFVILVDDIYTESKGIVEDCAQFLFDNGATDVVIYTLGMTLHNEDAGG